MFSEDYVFEGATREDRERLESLRPRMKISTEELAQLYAYVIAQGEQDVPRGRALFERLVGHVSMNDWGAAFAEVLGDDDLGGRAWLLPALAVMCASIPPREERLVRPTLERIAAARIPASEPLLVSTLCDLAAHELRVVCVEHLGWCGTPLTLHALDALKAAEQGALERALYEAEAILERRHPGARELIQGASLYNLGQVRAVLERSGLDEPQIDLYEDVARALAAAQVRQTHQYVFSAEPLRERVQLERVLGEGPESPHPSAHTPAAPMEVVEIEEREGADTEEPPAERPGWLERIEGEPFEGIPHELHRRLLAHVEQRGGPARADLARFYERLNETQLRGLVRQTKVSAHEQALPVWTGLARRVTASTRKVLVERIAGAELMASAPFLERVAADAGEDVEVRRVAIQALGRTGNRLNLPALLPAREDRALRADAARAIEAIEQRYPAEQIDAQAGALSLTEPDEIRGALSVMGASAGEISLYQDVQESVGPTGEEPKAARAPARAPAGRGDLARLSAPPRRLGLIPLVTFLLGDSIAETLALGTVALSLVLAGAGIAQGSFGGEDGLSLACPLVLFGGAGALMMVLNLLPDSQWWRRMRALREGYVALGEVIERERERDTIKRNPPTYYHYTFRFMAEDGLTYTFTHTETDSANPRLEGAQAEPILYRPDEDGKPRGCEPVDALSHVHIDARGRFRPTWGAWARLGVLALVCAGLLWVCFAPKPIF